MKEKVYASAFILVLMVLAMNMVARYIERRASKQMGSDMAASAKRPHYGYYAKNIFAVMVLMFLVPGAIILFLLHGVLWLIIGLALLCFGIYLLVTYTVAMLAFHQSEPADLGDLVRLRGDEHALDIGCGLGKVTNAIAKNLTTGKVVGIDVWNKVEIPGNSPEKAYSNAELEGVRDRVEFREGNALKLEFQDASFDLVTAASVLNNMSKDEDKSRALREVVRVLRPGGRFLLIEPLPDLRGFLVFTPFAFGQLRKKKRWEELLKEAGLRLSEYEYKDGTARFLAQR